MAAVQLDPVLDLRAAKPLYERIRAYRGQPVRLDASAVRSVGGLCLQVLVAARAAWLADGVAFSIAMPSAAFLDGVRRMGAPELASEG